MTSAMATDAPAPPGLRKAAILLVLLGEEVASNLYGHLPQDQLQQLTQEIARLGFIPADEAATVLEEYRQLAVSDQYAVHGGRDYASKLLTQAFGEEQANTILSEVSDEGDDGTGNFGYLQKADPQQLAKFVEGEHPQTIALVLANLGPKSAASLLLMLPEELRAQAVQRLAGIRQFSPELVGKISSVLYKKLTSLGKPDRRSYGGVKAVADLLNSLDSTTGETILNNIGEEDPELTDGIRNMMFTFEDLINLPKAGIRDLLSQVDKGSLSLALRGASEPLKELIFGAMSSRAVQMLKEDMEVLGPVRSSEVERAQQEVIASARKLEAEGGLVLKPDQDEEYIV